MRATLFLIAVGSLVVVGCDSGGRAARQPGGDPGEVVAGWRVSSDRPVEIEPPPEPAYELRGAWIATVDNIDWPSQPGLSPAEQRGELIAILDRCAAIGLNAVVFQARPTADAFYRSDSEPWSAYLSGQQDEDPGYDPLELAVREAHARGLELHAWFNPYRTMHPSNKTVSQRHISQRRPEWVRQYGPYGWLDPGIPEVADYVLEIVRDMVARYDVDGVHMDDYFYPYPIREEGKLVEFPDEPSWRRYQESGGTLARDDWRRDNVNRFIERLYDVVHATRADVKVGISPFGIWRPGHPAQIKGFDQYASLYADAKQWLERGWVDYFTPQLYWPIDPPAQSYAALLNWWCEQNAENRAIIPGNAAYRVASGRHQWPADEIARQVQLTRAAPGGGGNIFFSMKVLMKNTGGVTDALQALYAEPALPAQMAWMDERPPARPRVRSQASGDGVELTHDPDDGPAAWVVQSRRAAGWEIEIHPGVAPPRIPGRAAAPDTDAIVIRAADRAGNLSAPLWLAG